MKPIYLFAIVTLVVVAALGLNTLNAAPLGTKAQTATAKTTRVSTRQPRQTKTPVKRPPAAATPVPIPDDSSDPDSAGAAPLLPTSPGPMTSQILVFNPDSTGTATVLIEIYNAGGTVAYSTTTSVSSNGYKLVNLPGSLGTNFQGGAVVSSDKNVQAIVVGANSANTARDAYEGVTAPNTTVTLPFVRHLAANTQNTLLAIQNTTGNPANVTVTFYNTDGSVANTQNAVLTAHQPLYLNTNAIFPNGTFVGSAQVTSDQNIAVAAQSLYYLDTASFAAMTSANQDTSLYLTQAMRKLNGANAAVNWSEIYARNNGTNSTDITINFYALDGTPITSQTTSAVPPGGQAQFLLSDPAYSALGNNFAGWAKISSSGEPLEATSLSVVNKGKRLYGENAQPQAAAASKYVCGDVAHMTNEYSQISILNTDPSILAKPVIVLYDPTTGGKLARLKVKLPPNSGTTVLMSDPAFAAAGSAYEGMAIVQTKGATPPKMVVTVSNPFGASKLTGTTGYDCTAIP